MGLDFLFVDEIFSDDFGKRCIPFLDPCGPLFVYPTKSMGCLYVYLHRWLIFYGRLYGIGYKYINIQSSHGPYGKQKASAACPKK